MAGDVGKVSRQAKALKGKVKLVGFTNNWPKMFHMQLYAVGSMAPADWRDVVAAGDVEGCPLCAKRLEASVDYYHETGRLDLY